MNQTTHTQYPFRDVMSAAFDPDRCRCSVSPPEMTVREALEYEHDQTLLIFAQSADLRDAARRAATRISERKDPDGRWCARYHAALALCGDDRSIRSEYAYLTIEKALRILATPDPGN